MLIAAVISSALLMGALWSLVPTMVGAARTHLQLQAGRELWLRVAFALTVIPSLVIGGLLVDWLGSYDVLILASLGCGFGLAVLGMSRNQQTALAGAAALGVAGGLLYTATTTSMPLAFFPFDPRRPPSAAQVGYIFVALGALATFLLLPRLVRRWGLRHTLLALALVALFPAGCVTLAGKDNFHRVEIVSTPPDLGLWLIALAAFFLLLVEVATIQWTPRYLADIGFRHRGQYILTAGFWVCFLLARLWAATFIHPVGHIWLVLVATCLAVIAIGNMIGWHNRSSGGIGFLFLGACLGPIFPSIIGLTLYYFPSAVAVGLVSALAMAGGLLAEPATAYPLLRTNVRLVMGFTMVLSLATATLALVFLLLPP
jgi:hypothetical protein